MFSNFFSISWIRLKYERKEFLCPLPASPSIEAQLESAIKSANIVQVALILCHMSGSNNEVTFHEKKTTPLQLAAQCNSIPIAQLIIWVCNLRNKLFK